MITSRSLSSKLFEMLNVALLAGAALLCLFPFLHMLAVSLSSAPYITAGRVTLWPMGFHVGYYRWALRNSDLHGAFFWSIARAAVGTGIGMILTILAAYPLSFGKQVFRAHNVIIALLLFAVLFDAGILAKYIVVRKVGLYDTFWSLVVPSVFNPWHVILLMNFFRELPEELKEAAMVEGARHVDILTLIYVPLAKPALATIALFTGVALWNEWFEPILYLRSSDLYPLQTYLRGIFTGARGSTNGLQGALTILAILPLILVYPFVQRYFERGIVLGAVKR